MRYCSRCILPDTRPGLKIAPNGVCSACSSHSVEAPAIDWDGRRARFEQLVDEVRGHGGDWDCVIPVSGGKDSTWQVVTCLEHGLRPLAVTWRTPARTELGQRNLDNLIALGVDHIDFTVNPAVERRFMLRTFEAVGTPAVPMHLAIFNIPTTVAVRYGIPLVVWGENSAMEYVGGEDESGSFELTAEWVRKYGAVHGTTADDWVGDGLSERDLAPYRGPSDEELREHGTRAVFLGMFFEWDPEETFRVAAAHGFEAGDRPRTGAWEYADVDDDFISIHHWLKWHKFGFTRVWDNLSVDIRNGRLTRDEAIAAVRELGDQTPHDDISAFCDYVEITEQRFAEICEKFRNNEIWSRRDGVWQIADFLIPGLDLDVNEKPYLADLEALKEYADGLEDTRMMAVAKVTAMALMNMRWERIMVDRDFPEHPWPHAQRLVRGAHAQLEAWGESGFIEGRSEPLGRPSDEMEERHHDLFQTLWVNFSEDDYEDRIARYTHRLDINQLGNGFFARKRVIDFGCGHGNFLHACLRAGAESGLGIDFGEDSIRYSKAARDRLGLAPDRLEFRHASVYESGEDAASYDIAIQNGVFHHLDDEDAAYREVHRVLKPGGWFWIYTDGAGAVSHDLWDAAVHVLRNVPYDAVLEVLDFLGVETNKRYHLGDGLNAVYHHATYDDFIDRVEGYGFGNPRRLVGGFPTDFDHDVIEADPWGREKFGDGDIRVLVQKL